MNPEQKQKVEQAKMAYNTAAVTSKFVSENKETVQWMGQIAGKDEETKAMISTSEIIHQGISAVDKAQGNIKSAQLGTYDQPGLDLNAYDTSNSYGGDHYRQSETQSSYSLPPVQLVAIKKF